MAKGTSKNAVYDFASTIYACLGDISVNGSNNIASGECSTDGTGPAIVEKAAGANNWTVQATAQLDSSSATVPAALVPGTSGALKVYPFSDETGDLEYSWTTAIVATSNVAGATSTLVMIDVTFECVGDTTPIVKV